ncbi:MAG: prepilin-type N-terminal cleavage/methylation domain-containing protein [Verrucomicrobia bacterium]|nr:prepilin-type N-terminal cleavage/methylation domain-containing protein [Verrucomicrobiota bacterium]
MTTLKALPAGALVSSPRPGRQGFTLLELLVAMSILALLLILLLSMVNGATKLWRANENRVDSYREARAAINFIASDLAAVYPSANPNYFYSQKDKKPATPVKITNMDGSLFFLTALPPAAQGKDKANVDNKSDLCTVGYYLGYDKTSLTGKGTASYNLYRYFRSSNDTFTALQNADDILNGVSTDTSTNGNSEVLAKNITGFKVVPYEIPTATIANPSPTPTEFTKKAENPLPDMLEITVTAVNNDVAKRFGNDKKAWESADSRTRQEYDRTFTTRIYLAAGVTSKEAAKEKAAAEASPSPSPTP